MSTVSTTHINEGDTNSVAAPNATMTSWQTATADYNEDNLRIEGMDRRNLSTPRYNNSGTQLISRSGTQTFQSNSTYAVVNLTDNIAVTWTPGGEQYVRVRCSVSYELDGNGVTRSHTGYFQLEVQVNSGGWSVLTNSEHKVQLGFAGDGTYTNFENRGCITFVRALSPSGSTYEVRLTAKNEDSGGGSTYDMRIKTATLSIEAAGT